MCEFHPCRWIHQISWGLVGASRSHQHLDAFLCGGSFHDPTLDLCLDAGSDTSPDPADEKERQKRAPMAAADRKRYFLKHAPILLAICLAYVLITLVRSLRADFAPELWRALGMEATPEVFSLSEMWVALGIMLCSGLFSAYRDNRRALRHGLLAATAGLGILLISLMGLRWQWLGAFPFMVLTGLGLYLPYVLVHTTLFERLMAVTRDGGNLGFLMYLADSAGYLGYVGLMLAKKFLPSAR